MKVMIPSESELHELGFVTAAHEMKEHRAAVPGGLRQKLRIAFEHYRVVEPAHIERFNKELKEKTLKVKKVKRSSAGYLHTTTIRSFQQLEFTRIHNYTAAPPVEVLVELRKAKEMGCFDNFEIATIGFKTEEYTLSRPKFPDPILFGVIEGSENRYFITQWDDDVKIEDILKEDEG